MPTLNIRSNDYDGLVASGARSVTVSAKSFFSGSCTVITSGSGAIGAGTYYYRVNPYVGGEEILLPSQSVATTMAASSRAWLSWVAVTGSTGYYVYRSTNLNFPAPSLLGYTGSNNYYDNSGSASAGSPTGSYDQGGSWGDAILNLDSHTEQWVVFDKNPKDIALDEGFRYEDYRYAYAPSSCTVRYQDIVNFDGIDFIVTGITSIVVGSQRVAVKVHLRRFTAQALLTQGGA